MRISTLQMFNINVNKMVNQQYDINTTQQQISTGQKLQADSDDPVVANQLKTLNNTKVQLEEFQGNVTSAKNTLALEESYLHNFSDRVAEVLNLATSALNGGLNTGNLTTIGAQMQNQLNNLLSIANSKDAGGNYLFSGAQVKTQPFLTTAGVTTYQGDISQRYVKIESSTSVAISDAGNEIFSSKNSFTATPTATNSGTGVISNVELGTTYTPGTYTIQFDAAGTTYGVTDGQGNVIVAAGTAYTSGNVITFNGMQFTIEGTPGANDSFTISKSSNIFNVIQSMITALQAGNGSAALNARFVSILNNGQSALNDAATTANIAVSTVGARMQTVESTSAALQSLLIQNAQTISVLGETDLVAAASTLAQQQLILQAMQKAHTITSGLSLFKFL